MRHQLHVADFVVFALTIIVSLGIGIFYALSGGRQKTTSEFLVGGRTMAVWPVAISLMVSYESSILLLGTPAETYLFGVHVMIIAVSWSLANFLSVFIVVPLLHPLKLTSAYEYLEFRFKSRAVRYFATVLGMFHYIWYMGIVLFGPAVALQAVMGMPVWISVGSVGFVAVIYTSIGGLKAVIWTDVFQAGVMFTGIFAILIKGTIAVGGPKEVWDTARRGGRVGSFDFSPDPTIRNSFWSMFFGTFCRGYEVTFNQSTVQRLSSTRTISEAKRVFFVAAPAFLLSISLVMYGGIVAYAYYDTVQCDPFESKQINNPNQIIPFAVMDMFANLPGMPGLYMASLFSASLSTLSSGLSSNSALFYTDIVKPLAGDMTEKKATIIAKLSVLVFGICGCSVALLVSTIGGTLLQIYSSLQSAFAGPASGLFFLGCFFPRVPAKGALLGSIAGTIFTAWIAMGMNFSPSVRKAPQLPPASTAACDALGVLFNDTAAIFNVNHTTVGYDVSSFSGGFTSTVETGEEVPLKGVAFIYNLSYHWIAPTGIFSTIIFGLLFSLLTGMNKPGDVDPRYLLNISDSVFVCCPRSFRSWLRTKGAQFIDEKYKEQFPDPTKTLDIWTKEIEIELMTTSIVQNDDTHSSSNERSHFLNDTSEMKELNGNEDLNVEYRSSLDISIDKRG